jgi:cyclopropane fatty-acyl-phospholipid synthase-like methyltransferase
METVRRASDRYVGASITAWEFARGKLGGDSVYRKTLSGGLLHSGETLMDLGCGQGLMLALLLEARRTFEAGGWPPDWPEPPRFTTLVGVELRRRAASLAERALGGSARIVQADINDYATPPCDAILLFDVLQMMPRDRQNALIATAATRLRRGGVMLVREADASSGWRVEAVRAGNQLKAIVLGAWRQRFHFRSTNEWLACFERAGFDAAVVEPEDGRPHVNVLLRAVKR